MSGEAETLPFDGDDGEVTATGSSSGAGALKRKSSGPDVDEDDSAKRQKNNEGLASVVAKHYNELPEKGVEARSESRIFHMRSFNNWTKSMLINDAMKRLRAKHINSLNILDLCCGKGGDILKWLKTNMAEHIAFADIAETSIEQCKERYGKSVSSQKQQRYPNRNEKLFTAEFIAADCTKERLRDKYRDQTLMFDLVSCQFSFHYCFESYAQAKTMLQNISENLRTGGLFIGTIPNACRIVRRLRDAGGKQFGNSVFRIEVDCDEPFPVFGAKYYFHLEEVVNCPEFLVHFSALEKLARLHGLRLLFKHTFDEYFQQNQADGRFLLERMQALQAFSEGDLSKISAEDEEFSHIRQSSSDNKKQQYFGRIATLSRSEWEAISLYTVFIFEKL